MASMGFSANTVMTLMSLVDEHKEEVTEASYVEMCNALRQLYVRFANPTTPRSHPSPVPRTVTATTTTTATTNTRTQRATFQPISIDTRIVQLEDRLRILESRLSDPGRIINEDKVYALEALLRRNSINAFSYETTFFTNWRVDRLKGLVYEHSQEIFVGENISGSNVIAGIRRHLLVLFRQQRDRRMDRFRSELRGEIESVRSALSTLRGLV